MTTCEDVRHLLSAYLDDEVSELERERIRRHLAGCGACSTELSELEKDADLLGRLDEADPPETLGPGLRRRIRRRAALPIVAVVLLLLAILPIATVGELVLRPDVPVWARAGFAIAAFSLSAALALLMLHLLRHVRDLVVYGYLSGGPQ